MTRERERERTQIRKTTRFDTRNPFVDTEGLDNVTTADSQPRKRKKISIQNRRTFCSDLVVQQIRCRNVRCRTFQLVTQPCGSYIDVI